MILSRDAFVQTMEEIERLCNIEDNIDNALKELSPDFGGFEMGASIGISISLLEHIMSDRNEWISYYIFDAEFGRSKHANSVTDGDGNKIPFNSLDDLYDLLLSNIIEPEELEEYDLEFDYEDEEFDEEDEEFDEEEYQCFGECSFTLSDEEAEELFGLIDKIKENNK